MGIIRAAMGALGGGLADQWLEVVEADNMGKDTVFTTGVSVRRNDKRGQNKKGTKDLITTGSTIMVGENQFMLLVDGGKIVDYSGEPGYFTVDNHGAPSLFNGQMDEAILHTFDRIKYGGVPSQSQKAYYVNTQEITNIPFGTANPINYFDNFYNAELYLRCHGYFSIRIIDPLKFYAEAVPRNAYRVDIGDINKMYLAEFLTALQTAIGKMSVDGIRISHVSSKSQELASYMSTVLDSEWTQRRGIIVESVGIASISYDDESKKLIGLRNQGAMLSDPSIREGYVQGSVARGIEGAGSNTGGAGAGFMGVQMGMQAGNGLVGAASAANQAQIERQEAAAKQSENQWKCSCGTVNDGKFCRQCGKQREDGGWTCSCGTKNTGKFCTQCGNKRLGSCPECGHEVAPDAKFCPNCGNKLG